MNEETTSVLPAERDIADSKEIEERISEAIRIKSRFLSMVSHELRTPLTSIKAGVDILLDGMLGTINPEQEEILGVARRNIEALHRLINDLLDLDKLESGKMRFTIQEVDVNEVVREVHELMLLSLNGSEIDFSLSLTDQLPRVRCDRDKIAQVIRNLVHNAIKFTEKGTITITTEQGENIIQVSVSDTGCGISKQDLPRAFFKFEQLEEAGRKKIEGSGLGLAISKEIIDQHRGKIFGESEAGKGTTFHIILPRVERRSRVRKEQGSLE